MAANTGFLAKENSVCKRCNQQIVAGEHWIVQYNRPVPGTTYHVHCPKDVDAVAELQPAEDPQPDPAPGTLESAIREMVRSELRRILSTI